MKVKIIGLKNVLEDIGVRKIYTIDGKMAYSLIETKTPELMALYLEQILERKKKYKKGEDYIIEIIK